MAIDFNFAPILGDEPTMRPDPDGFARAMREEGFKIDSVIADGSIQRVDDPTDKHGKKSGWYVCFDGFFGLYGSWKDETLGGEWSIKNKVTMSPRELSRLHGYEQEARAKMAEEKARVWANAAREAEMIMKNGGKVQDHPYLQKKSVKPAGEMVIHNGAVAVPLKGIDGTLSSVQFIYQDGKKLFLTGSETGGKFWTIPGTGGTAICEGVATGLSIHEATGWQVVVTFSAHNLPRVAQEWRLKHPTETMIICGDDDHATKGNPGKKAAEEAGALASAKVVIPAFSNVKGTDFNDLHQSDGLDAVRAQLAGLSKHRVDILKWSMDQFAGPAPEREWLIKGVLPLGCVCLFAAMGDAGKGMLTLDIAAKVAGPKGPLPEVCLGGRVVADGPAVILTAEDDKDEMHRRLESVVPSRHELQGRLFVVPLPNTGGPAPFVTSGPRGPMLTDFWPTIREQLIFIKPKLVVFDPLASFVMADINADPAAGAFVMGQLASLAQEAGSTIIICHHLAKSGSNITTPEQARSLVRGTTALVDGSRAVYCLWQADQKRMKNICDQMGIKPASNRVFFGSLVKANGPGDREIKTFVRNDSGLLVDRTEDVHARVKEENEDMAERILEAIEHADPPFTFTGKDSGIINRQAELPEPFNVYGRDKLQKYISALMNSELICKGKKGFLGRC